MRVQCAKFASGRSGPNGDHRRRMPKWNRCRDPPSGMRHHLEPRVVLLWFCCGFAVVCGLWWFCCGAVGCACSLARLRVDSESIRVQWGFVCLLGAWLLVVPHRPGREDQGTLAQRTREAAGQAGQGTRHLAMSYVATARTPGPFAFAQNRARLSPKSSAFGPSPVPFSQVQRIRAKSSTSGPSPVISVQRPGLLFLKLPKSRAFGPNPRPNPGVLGQVQPL